MMARNTNVPCKGRIQKRKTHHLQIITFGLQRAAGPYRTGIGLSRTMLAIAVNDAPPNVAIPHLSIGQAPPPGREKFVRSMLLFCFAPEPTPFVQCRLLGLADSPTRFQRWPLSPGVREKTRQRPFLSHGGPRNLHSARTERPTNQNEIPWSAVVELQSHRRVSRNENSISALSPKHRRNRF